MYKNLYHSRSVDPTTLYRFFDEQNACRYGDRRYGRFVAFPSMPPCFQTVLRLKWYCDVHKWMSTRRSTLQRSSYVSNAACRGNHRVYKRVCDVKCFVMYKNLCHSRWSTLHRFMYKKSKYGCTCFDCLSILLPQ